MKLFCSIDLVYFMVVVSVFLINLSAADLEQGKNRRGTVGTAGLFAFPRVGRSDSNLEFPSRLTDDINDFERFMPSSLEEYEEYPKIGDIKRANLIAFPRVGRSDVESQKWARLFALQQSIDKSNSGLWFPSRLEKIQKRSTSQKKHKKAETF